MRIVHEPEAIGRVLHVIGRDHRYLAGIIRTGLLTIPGFRLRELSPGVRESVRLEQNSLNPSLLEEPSNRRQGLVPVKIGIIDQSVSWSTKSERIKKRKVVGIGLSGDGN